ncbi:ATP phosphoribosyltransferase regulatory subunit [Anaerolineae bacterium CFX7]|nr:ATP phosphoribosyltransferase regulatory subunit [Anaerolineae bacterium CFX7]
MLKTFSVERQLPHGVADLYFQEAARKTRLETRLREIFAQWNYTQVIPPTFEYYETLAAEASPQVRQEIYRFPDRDGRMLALRADPTIPIARLVGTKLYDQPLPLRFFYVANVFRHEEPKASLRREFTQAGVELIGCGTAQADAEIIALAVTALRALGLNDFRLRVGAMDFINALLGPLALTETQRAQIKSALERKNQGALDDALRQTPMPPTMRRALAALPALTGGAEILERAAAECAVNPAAQDALARLRALWQTLDALDVAAATTLDLGMVRGMAYYTGIVFEAFARGIGFALLSGGRYDHLLAHFGGAQPACGFAIGVERALAALKLQNPSDVQLTPDIVAELGAARALAERVAEARAQGQRVEWYLQSGSHAEISAYARQRGARRVWFADGGAEEWL